MSPVVDGILKTSTVLFAAWLIAALPMRWAAAARHLLWLVAVIAAILIPVVIAVLPAWELRVLQPKSSLQSRQPVVIESPSTFTQPAAASEFHQSVTQQVASLASTGWRPLRGLAAVWLIGFLIGVMRAVWGWGSVSIIASAHAIEGDDWRCTLSEIASALNLTSEVTAIISDRIQVPGVWGILKPKLLLPVEALCWDQKRRRLVLLHELAHVQRRDCLAQAVGQLMRAIHWFNPLAVLAFRRLREEQERACDDVVLQAGVCGDEYASHLLDLALASRENFLYRTATVSMARPSSIATRVRAILDTGLNRRPVAAGVYGISILFACVSVISLGTMRVTARETKRVEVQPVSTSQSNPPRKTASQDAIATPAPQAKPQKKLDFSGTWFRANDNYDEWPFGNYVNWTIRQTDSEIRLDASSVENGAYHMVWYFNRWGKRWGTDWTNQVGRAQWDGARLVTVMGGDGDEIKNPWIFDLSPDGKTITAEAVQVGKLGLSFDFKVSSISQVYVRHRLSYLKASQ